MQQPDNIPFTMPFAEHLGIEVTEASADKVVATLTVRPELCTTGARLHGGVIMAFADNLGAIAAYLNLPEASSATTTIESKTNFVGAAKLGEQITGETSPVHVGRRTSVWQTQIRTATGKKVAVVTQTQLVL
jgi:uncharacterized protein (TIGR00369 family)